MTVGITQLANWTVSNALGVYYDHAFHRTPATFLSLPAISPSLPSTVSAVPLGRPFHFFRGMLHFEPSAPYMAMLGAYGFQPRVFHFPSAAERDLLRQWRENTGDVLNHFIARPEAIGERPVFCGHSAGGLTVYVLAALAKGGEASAIREECPGLESVPLRSLESLRERLAQALFVTIASPLQGVRLTRVGRCVNRLLVEPFSPLFFSGLTKGNLEAFYRKVNRRPEDVIDANLVSDFNKVSFRGGPVSRLSSLLIQGGMRVFSPFLDHEAENDGIVPKDAALLRLPPRNGARLPSQAFAPFDHLKLVESPEAALALVDLIRQADPFAEKLS